MQFEIRSLEMGCLGSVRHDRSCQVFVDSGDVLAVSFIQYIPCNPQYFTSTVSLSLLKDYGNFINLSSFPAVCKQAIFSASAEGGREGKGRKEKRRKGKEREEKRREGQKTDIGRRVDS